MFKTIKEKMTIPVASAHCDGPCGVYDPASARIAAEAVLSMTKKLINIEQPVEGDLASSLKFHGTLARYSAIKEEEAQRVKDELLILWTDYFKPPHLEAFPNLHETFWKAAKLCSACKVEINEQHANELMAAVKEIHEMFWKSKNREVEFYTAS